MASLRRKLLVAAAYLVRHTQLPHQWVDGLAAAEWHVVTSPFGAVNGQDGAKDKLCVRLTSVMFSQDPLSGVYSGMMPCSNNHTTKCAVRCPARLSMTNSNRSG